MNILGLIPARGGSKGIPKKNLYPILNEPLIRYTIDPALQSDYLSNVIVSTDSDEIAQVSRDLGAEAPFIRPKDFANDHSSALDVVVHAIDFYRKQGIEFELIVYLQPTSPLRTTKVIDECIKMMADSDADSLVSVMDVPHQYSVDSQMYDVDGYLEPLGENGIGRLRRQEKVNYVARNGPAVLITRPNTIERFQSLYGTKTLSYKMEKLASLDIDDLDDVWFVEQALIRQKQA